MLSNLAKRVLFAVVAIPLFIFVLYSGGLLLHIVILILSSLALHEYFSMVGKSGAKVISAPAYGFNFLIILLNYLSVSGIIYLGTTEFILIMSLVFILNMGSAAVMHLFFGSKEHITNEIGMMTHGLQYISIGFISILLIPELFAEAYPVNPPVNPNLLSIIVFAAIWASDTFAYFVGRKFGKHKLLESISPNKTVEGFVGGVLGSAIVFTLPCVLFFKNHSTLALATLIILGIVIGLMGTVGDLVESSLKRHAGVKDSSNLIPGHGGILDRFDSALFVFPTMFIALELWVLLAL